MPKEAGQQQYCITIDRDQVPSISVLEAVSEVALLGAIRLVELLPYIDAKDYSNGDYVPRGAFRKR